MSEVRKFLFIETFLLGDLIYLGALISAVRAQHPDAQIDVLASSITRDFPFLKRLNVKVHHFDFPWSRIGWHSHPFSLIKALIVFKKQYGRQFTDYVALDPRGDIRHTLLAWLLQPYKFIKYHSGARFPNAWRGASLRHVFSSRQEFFRQITQELCLGTDLVLPWPWLKDFYENAPNKSANTILLAPEASTIFKYWKSERWKQLSNQLRLKGYHTTLIIHRGDAVTDNISENFDEVWHGSISDLGSLVATSYAVISVDSFIGHLAAAMNIPVVSLFGTQSPELWRPWGGHTAIVMEPAYPCRPCNQRRCVLPNASCMNAIQVDQVIRAFNSLIGQ